MEDMAAPAPGTTTNKLNDSDFVKYNDPKHLASQSICSSETTEKCVKPLYKLSGGNMIIYPPETQIIDSDFVFNFVATYHISKIYTQRTLVQVNFTDYKLQTNLSLDTVKVNCTNLTWSVWGGCRINRKCTYDVYQKCSPK
jgi:hypothetical protein